MSSRNRARPTATKGQEPERSTPTRLQIRLKSAAYKGLLAACEKQATDASSLMKDWLNHLLKPPRTGKKIADIAEPPVFKEGRALVLDARLHVSMDAAILAELKRLSRAQGIAHTCVARGCVNTILALHRAGQDISPPPTRTRRER